MNGSTSDPMDVNAELRWTVSHAYQGSAFFREHLDAAGVTPDQIRGLADLHRLPFTTKQQLRDHSPWGWTAVPMEEVVRVHASSGTTGRRTICIYTTADLEAWTQQMVRCMQYAGLTAEDRVQLAVGYGLWTAGIGFQPATERLGALAIPTGPGNTQLQLDAMGELGTTVLCATASFALLLAELIEDRGLREKLELRVGITGSERWGETTRCRIQTKLGVETFDCYGLTELYRDREVAGSVHDARAFAELGVAGALGPGPVAADLGYLGCELSVPVRKRVFPAVIGSRSPWRSSASTKSASE